MADGGNDFFVCVLECERVHLTASAFPNHSQLLYGRRRLLQESEKARLPAAAVAISRAAAAEG